MSVELFYSYAHEDESFRDEIEKHLSILKRNGLIVAWHDRRIGAGDEWRDQIDTHARSADIILLLISPDFLASDYCYNIEMKLALERHATGAAVVVPIILRPVDWSDAPFAELQALPRDGRAVTTWGNRDEAFASVAQGIHAIVTGFISSSSGVKDPHGLPRDAAQSRMLDAAMPSHIVKDRTAELEVLIRLPDSAGLKGVLQQDKESEARPEDVLSKDFKINFPRRPDGGVDGVKVQVTLTAPDFNPSSQTKQLIVPPDTDSDVVSFFLTALRTGKLKVLVELQWEETVRGARRLVTECVAEAATIPADAGQTVVRMPLNVGIGKDRPSMPALPTAPSPPAAVRRPAPVAREEKASYPSATVPKIEKPRSKSAWLGASSVIAAAVIVVVVGLNYPRSTSLPPTSTDVDKVAPQRPAPQTVEPPNAGSRRGTAPAPAKPENTTRPEAPALQQELNARLSAGLDELNKLSQTQWLDGDANTAEGTPLRFAGQKLFGLLYSLDHPTGTVPNVPNVAFLGIVERLRNVTPEQDRLRLQQTANQYRNLKRLLSDLPGENDVAHKMTRPAVNSTLKRARMLLDSMQQKQ